MATVDDLLRALHRQAVRLPGTGEPGRRLQAHLCGWRGLATGSLRVLESLDPGPKERELYGLLRTLAAAGGTRSDAVDRSVERLALIVGAIGDIVMSEPTTVAQAGQPQRSRLQASIHAALHATARATFDLASRADQTSAGEVVYKVAELTETAALLPPSARVSTLERLTLPRLSTDTLDGAVELWAGVARRIFTSDWLVTGVALQDAAATLSLLNQTLTSALREAARRRVLDPEAARTAADCTQTAAEAWRKAAAWPTNVQLGGRAHEHQHAVRAVREALNGPPLARLSLRQQTHALRAAASSAVEIGSLQAAAVTRLVDRGGLWIARERTNLRPPGVERRHVKLDWETMWWGNPTGRLLIRDAQAAQAKLAVASAAVNQAVLPGVLSRGDSGQIVLIDNRIVTDWWESVTSAPGTRTRLSTPGPASSRQGISR